MHEPGRPHFGVVDPAADALAARDRQLVAVALGAFEGQPASDLGKAGDGVKAGHRARLETIAATHRSVAEILGMGRPGGVREQRPGGAALHFAALHCGIPWVGWGDAVGVILQRVVTGVTWHSYIQERVTVPPPSGRVPPWGGNRE